MHILQIIFIVVVGLINIYLVSRVNKFFRIKYESSEPKLIAYYCVKFLLGTLIVILPDFLDLNLFWYRSIKAIGFSIVGTFL